MKSRYAEELGRLDGTYERALTVVCEALVQEVEEVASHPLIAVGSGGSQAAAHFAASLHNYYSGQIAVGLTPLELLSSTIPRRSSVLIVSARGRNPDSLAALQAAERAEVDHTIVVTCSPESPLAQAALTPGNSTLAVVGTPGVRDGYLATNTLVATATALLESFGAVYEDTAPDLPPTIRALVHPDVPRSEFLKSLSTTIKPLTGLEHLVTLFGGWASTAAIDIESRLTESALCGVQATDFRNFAHGRHQWLVRRDQTSGVLSFATPSVSRLARKTLDKIPKSVVRVEVSTRHEGPVAGLALLVQSLFCIQAWSDAVGVDPASPKVPGWCRRLFRMHPAIDGRYRSPVAMERKLGYPINAESGVSLRKKFRTALNRLQDARIAAIVLDYDGTVVETNERFSDPRDDIAEELSRLLYEGISLGVASGRGKSIRKSLRRALPRKTWSHILIGYYNGTDLGLLSDSTRPDGTARTVHPDLRKVLDVISANGMKVSDIEERPRQLTLSPLHPMNLRECWEIVQGQIVRHRIPARVVLSSHSIDILPSSASKLDVVNQLTAMASCQQDEILRIGDMGAWPGNDHDLLNHFMGLSVRTPPAGHTDGWNLAPRGETGTRALLRYLQAVKKVDGGFWKIQLKGSGLITQ